ncbi:MAG: hypothetical protein R3251_04450 [Candidatus Spechtbacterales bacterium]|nr:hypothetical protein [Candidatus Spechtbacterales bacterium]
MIVLYILGVLLFYSISVIGAFGFIKAKYSHEFLFYREDNDSSTIWMAAVLWPFYLVAFRCVLRPLGRLIFNLGISIAKFFDQLMEGEKNGHRQEEKDNNNKTTQNTKEARKEADQEAGESTGEEVESAPDSFKPLVGYRVWRLYNPFPVLYAGALRNSIAWTTGTTEAMCINEKAHKAPAEDCDCGIYALVDMWSIMSRYKPSYHITSEDTTYKILGSVVLWGKIVPGDKGYKAQKAAVAALYVPKNMEEIPAAIEEAAQIYGVPIVRTFESMTKKAEILASEMAGELDETFHEIIEPLKGNDI